MRYVLNLSLMAVLACFIASTPGPAAQEAAYEKAEYGGAGIIAAGPIVTGFEGATAILEFETSVPTPAARAYFGVVLDEEDPGYPRYRRSVRERLPEGQAETTTHTVRMDIGRLERPIIDTELMDAGGGHVEYRIELFHPGRSLLFVLDSRFRYTREGPSETGEYALALALTEGPFVDMVTHSSAVISWSTDGPSTGAVLLGGVEFIAEGESAVHEVVLSGLAPRTSYEYSVRYTKDGDRSRAHRFKTAPAPGDAETIRFGLIGDGREGVVCGEESLNGVNVRHLTGFLSMLHGLGADFICFGGDLVNGYTSSRRDFVSQLKTWKRAAQPVGSSIPIYEGIGNHEQVGDYFKVPREDEDGSHYLMFADRSGEESVEAIFAHEFVNPPGSAYGFAPPEPERRAPGLGGAETGPTYDESVYSFNYGNVHIVVANSNYWYTGIIGRGGRYYMTDRSLNDMALRLFGGNREGYMRDNQLAWIDRDLRAAQEDPDVDWSFVVLHEPAFPNGGHVDDAMYWGEIVDGVAVGYNDHDAPLGDVVDMRDRFWKILNKHDKVIALLCGDEHNYSRTLIDESVDPDYRLPIWQIVSGGCGAPYYGPDETVPWAGAVASFSRLRHCCLFVVEGDRVGLEIYSDRGVLIDSVEDLAGVRR
jgi:hypothetical protein